MKTRFTILISLFLAVSNLYGQNVFQKDIYTITESMGSSVALTNDGGYIMAGETYFFSGLSCIYLVRTNSAGDTLWARVYNDGNNDRGNAAIQTSDGGFIVAGVSSGTVYNEQVYVIKTDAAGAVTWSKGYGSTGDEYGYSIQQTLDGGYIVAGTAKDFRGISLEFYLLKIDASGGLTWTRTFGGSGSEQGASVEQTNDSGYIVCGISTGFGAGNYDAYLVKTKPNGDTLWTRTYGGTNTDIGTSARQTADSGYIITGYTSSFGAGNEDVYLIRTNANGDTLWTRTYGGTGNDEGHDVQQTADGGYIIAGLTYSFGAGSSDVYLIKTDANGDTLWTKTYGGTGEDGGTSVKQTPDGGYVIGGSADSFRGNQAFSSFYLIKTDADGNSGCYQGNAHTIVHTTATQVKKPNTQVYTGGAANSFTANSGKPGNDSTLCLTVGVNESAFIQSQLTLYPNPTTGQLTIMGNPQGNEHDKLSIINTFGQTVLQSEIKNPKSEISVTSLAPGLYFVRIEGEKESWTGRFVKE